MPDCHNFVSVHTDVLRSILIIQSIIYTWWRIIRGREGGLINFLPQKRGGGLITGRWLIYRLLAYWRLRRGLNRGFTAYLTWSSTKISSWAAKPLRCLGLRVCQVLKNLAWTYLQLNLQLSQIFRHRRQRAQTIWGQGSFAPARHGGNNQKCGKRENIHNKGIWV